MFETTVDRRNFLRGSALFAAAIGLKVAVPAAAQQEQDQDQSQPKPQEKKDPFADGQGQERREDLHRPGRSGVPHLPAVRLQHVQAGPHVGVRQLRLQLRGIVPADATTAPGSASPRRALLCTGETRAPGRHRRMPRARRAHAHRGSSGGLRRLKRAGHQSRHRTAPPRRARRGAEDHASMTLAGRTVFITGASRGIGLAIGLRAAADGANVVVTGKTVDPHPKLPGHDSHRRRRRSSRPGGHALAVAMDVREEPQVQRCGARPRSSASAASTCWSTTPRPST